MLNWYILNSWIGFRKSIFSMFSLVQWPMESWCVTGFKFNFHNLKTTFALFLTFLLLLVSALTFKYAHFKFSLYTYTMYMIYFDNKLCHHSFRALSHLSEPLLCNRLSQEFFIQSKLALTRLLLLQGREGWDHGWVFAVKAWLLSYSFLYFWFTCLCSCPSSQQWVVSVRITPSNQSTTHWQFTSTSSLPLWSFPSPMFVVAICAVSVTVFATCSCLRQGLSMQTELIWSLLYCPDWS